MALIVFTFARNRYNYFFSDSDQAFQKAWEEACSSKGGVVFVVPQGKSYLLKPIRFEGPCKSDLTIEVSLMITNNLV